MLRANEASVFFDQIYLKKEYIYIILIFPMQIDIWKNGQQTRFDVRYRNPQDI